jgi:hypothetical protein
VHRILRRHGLIEPGRRRGKRREYRRWERETPMALWQIDIVGGLMLADGTECKVVTGVDDHSQLCVMACVVPRRPGGRCAWCLPRHYAATASPNKSSRTTANNSRIVDRRRNLRQPIVTRRDLSQLFCAANSTRSRSLVNHLLAAVTVEVIVARPYVDVTFSHRGALATRVVRVVGADGRALISVGFFVGTRVVVSWPVHYGHCANLLPAHPQQDYDIITRVDLFHTREQSVSQSSVTFRNSHPPNR